MRWRSRLHSCVLAVAGVSVATIVLGPALLATAGASAQTLSTDYGLTGRTIRLPLTLPPHRPAWRSYWYRPDNVEPDNGQRFRTVCVRACDGYYWPISFSTTRGQFFGDEAQCQSSCNGGARLFYHPNPGGGMSDAVDLEGRAYTQLSSAFLYRRKRVDGCTCRPAPWSEAELARHRRYLREAEAAAANPAAAALADAPSDIDAQPPPVSIGSGGMVLSPVRIEPYRWYGRASPYRLLQGPHYLNVAPGIVLRRHR
jgi:hypothetical protein